MIKLLIAVILLIEFDLGIGWWALLVIMSAIDVYLYFEADKTQNTIINNQVQIENQLENINK